MNMNQLTPIITKAISRWLSVTDKKVLAQLKQAGAVSYRHRLELADRIAAAVERAERSKRRKSDQATSRSVRQAVPYADDGPRTQR